MNTDHSHNQQPTYINCTFNSPAPITPTGPASAVSSAWHRHPWLCSLLSGPALTGAIAVLVSLHVL